MTGTHVIYLAGEARHPALLMAARPDGTASLCYVVPDPARPFGARVEQVAGCVEIEDGVWTKPHEGMVESAPGVWTHPKRVRTGVPAAG